MEWLEHLSARLTERCTLQVAAFQCSQSLPLLCDIHEGVSSLWGRSLLEKSKDQPPSLNNQDQEVTWIFQDTGGNPQPAENRHCGSTVDDHRDDHDEEGGGEDHLTGFTHLRLTLNI